MNHSTTTPATGSVTFNPYLPAIGRVYEVLQRWSIGGQIECTNRDLADAAGLRSAGHIPAMLRQLERDGLIVRVASAKGTLIELIPESDQPGIASGCDPESDQTDGVATRDQASAVEIARSAMTDPPPAPPHMVLTQDSMQQQQQHARDRKPNISEQERDPRIALMQEFNVLPRSITEILRRRPEIRGDEITAKGRSSQTRTDIDAPRLLTHCLLNNEPLYSQEELHARQAATRAPAAGVAAHRSQRPAADARPRRPAADPAFLDQIRAANPGL